MQLLLGEIQYREGYRLLEAQAWGEHAGPGRRKGALPHDGVDLPGSCRIMKGIHIGTSGWHYRHRQERFYPAELAPSAWLTYYAREFNCVELNNSFYRLPAETTLRAWVEQTPADFLFAVKASRLITHRSKLHECDALLQTFLHRIRGLGSKLSPILLQLPPRWHVNPERLRAFLPHLPAEQRFAIEFRDPSWHTPEIYDLLRTYQVAFCQFDLGGFQ